MECVNATKFDFTQTAIFTGMEKIIWSTPCSGRIEYDYMVLFCNFYVGPNFYMGHVVGFLSNIHSFG